MAAGQDAVVEIRPLETIAEFEEAVRLQKQIWGFADIELLPRRLFVVANKVGGQTFGAFDGNRMVAFLIAIPGLKPDGRHYLHSHMLGTLPEYRNRGVGRALKLRQREDALARGIELVEWTFDPLEIKNAYFNIERLGAVVRRFVPNQYGCTSSHLHGGLPTDRCVAEWWLKSAHVQAVLDGRRPPAPPVRGRIEVPADIAAWRLHDPERARRLQDRVREQFLEYLRQGLQVSGFEISPQGGAYLLTPLDGDD